MIQKNTNVIRLPARAGEGILTWTFIIGMLFFRLMPHFKMVKNTLWGRRRCTRRRRCCEWDSKRSAWGYWYLNRNIVLTMFEKKFPPFQKTLFQHYNIETHLYWVKRKRVLKSWCSLDQMNMILPYYLAPDSTVNLFQTDGWRGRYEATHFFYIDADCIWSCPPINDQWPGHVDTRWHWEEGQQRIEEVRILSFQVNIFISK